LNCTAIAKEFPSLAAVPIGGIHAFARISISNTRIRSEPTGPSVVLCLGQKKILICISFEDPPTHADKISEMTKALTIKNHDLFAFFS
jgi:hypothetical protein